MSEAIIILPDMHLDMKKENRYHYNMECVSVIEFILELASSYRERGFEKVSAISVGDLCDRGKGRRRQYVEVQQQIKLLISGFDNFYLNFGNHEITYYKDNPVYSFIRSIDNTAIRKLFPQLSCESRFDEILTPDTLEYEDFEIVFRGWGTWNGPKTNKTGVLILHDTLLSDRGLSQLYATNTYEGQIYNADVSVFKYVFCGHVHSVNEVWNRGETCIINTASLLRTNVREISDLDRVRQIPCILVDDYNRFNKLESNEIILHERETIVDETSLLEKQENYREALFKKKVNEIGESPGFDVEDPMQELSELIARMGDVSLSETFSKLLLHLRP